MTKKKACFSCAIQIAFGLDIYMYQSYIEIGKLTTTENIYVYLDTTIQLQEQEGRHKYLGVKKGDEHAKMKKKAIKKRNGKYE